MRALIIILVLGLLAGCGFNNASEVKDGTYKVVYQRGPTVNGMEMVYDGSRYKLRFYFPPSASYVTDRYAVKHRLYPDKIGKYIYLTREYLEGSGGLYFTSGGFSYVLPGYYIEGFLEG